ncbi:hypothetical protein GCM10027421_10300 [Microbacterium shaanxiense]
MFRMPEPTVANHCVPMTLTLPGAGTISTAIASSPMLTRGINEWRGIGDEGMNSSLAEARR